MEPCGMEGPPPVIAVTGRSWRQIDPRVRGEVGSSLDNVGAGRNYQTARARERGRKGVGKPNQWQKPRESSAAWESGGWVALRCWAGRGF